MKLHNQFLMFDIDNAYFRYKIDEIKYKYFKSNSARFIKVDLFMKSVKDLINEIEKHDNSRFKLSDKLRECERANSILINLFNDYIQALNQDDLKEEKKLEKQIDILIKENY